MAECDRHGVRRTGRGGHRTASVPARSRRAAHGRAGRAAVPCPRRGYRAPRTACGMDALNTIHLDMIDGHGFKRACWDIFSRAGWGRAELIGNAADGGKDLLIRSGDGSLTIVKCKHQPSRPVGRIAVQKLYSAVMSEGASRGIVVTTGSFTSEARDHAALLSRFVRIDLFDRSRLVDLADRAGILVVDGLDMQVQYLPDAGDAVARSALLSRFGGLQSYPSPPAELAVVAMHAVHLEPFYLAWADVRQDFVTGVGPIHSASAHDVPVVVDARSGSACDPDTEALVAASPLEDGWDGPGEGVRVWHRGFRCGGPAARRAAADHLARLYTKRVSYTGRNGVRRSKVCKVLPKKVYFADFRQVLLPVHHVVVAVLQSRYPCTVVRDGGDGGVRISAPGLGECGICRKGLRGDAALCNACGAVHHPPRILGCRGYRCRECGKTVCRRCAFWTRRMLLFKKIVCGDCASGAESAQRMR